MGYNKKWYKQNRKRILREHKIYWKKYSVINKERLIKKSRQYYQKNKEKYKIYRQINHDKIKIRCAIYYQKNRKKIREKWNKYYNKKYKETLASWYGIIPQKTKCQICKKDIFFGKRNGKQAIHFDHRNGGSEQIIETPTSWLYRNKRTLEKEDIWKLCNFGMLCKACNSFLPTKNRNKFLKRLIKYVKK